MKKLVLEGGLVPKGYGLAWHEYDRRISVAYPIPLNFVASWLRRVKILLVQNRTWQSGYDRGYRQGLEAGKEFGFYLAHNQTITNELRNVIDNYYKAEVKAMEDSRKGKNIDGWAYHFIEKEKKRLHLERPKPLTGADKEEK